jgi:hypothetical protein
MVVMVVFAGGCGGSSNSSGTTAGFATASGSSVLTPAIKRVTLAQTSGGLGAQPVGDCSPLWSYTLSLDTKRLALNCTAQADGTVTITDDVALTDPVFATLVAAAQAVTVSGRRECGADFTTRELRVESATAMLTYGDDFWGCLRDHDEFVTWEGLNSLEAALQAIAP